MSLNQGEPSDGAAAAATGAYSTLTDDKSPGSNASEEELKSQERAQTRLFEQEDWKS